MKGKITRGAGFCGLLDYVFDVGINATRDKGARLIVTNMAGENPRMLAAEFAALRKLRPGIERPVWHMSMRAPDGETLIDEKWDILTRDAMTGIGINPDNHPYVVVMHDDNHIHIVSSRIGLDGTLYYGKNEHLIATRVLQELEKKHGLTITKGPTYSPAGKIVMPDSSKLSRGEMEMKKRGEILPREQLQKIIKAGLKNRPTLDEFERRIIEAGVTFKRSSGGYSFCFAGVAFKGSSLGKFYSYTNIKNALSSPEEARIKASRAAAWDAEQRHRDRFRANRSIVKSVGSLAACILPRPLGDVVQLAVETLILIGKIIDWTQAHNYKRHVARLKTQLHHGKIDQLATVKLSARVSLDLIETLSSVDENNSNIQQPASDSVVRPDVIQQHSKLLDFSRIAAIDKAIVRLNWQAENDHVSQIEYDKAIDRLEAELRNMVNAAPGTRIEINYGAKHPISVDGVSVGSLPTKQLPSLIQTPKTFPAKLSRR